MGKAIEKVEDGIKSGAGFAGSVSRVARQIGDRYDDFSNSMAGTALRAGLSVVPGGAGVLAAADSARGFAETVEQRGRDIKKKGKELHQKVGDLRGRIDKISDTLDPLQPHPQVEEIFDHPRIELVDDEDGFYDAQE